MSTPTVQSIAARAAEVIRARGFHQGAYAASADDDACPVDVVGAVSVALAGNPFKYHPDERAVLREFCRAAGCRDASDFNDAPGRTAEEILAVLDAIAGGRS